jgi:hypothetical protein
MTRASLRRLALTLLLAPSCSGEHAGAEAELGGKTYRNLLADVRVVSTESGVALRLLTSVDKSRALADDEIGLRMDVNLHYAPLRGPGRPVSVSLDGMGTLNERVEEAGYALDEPLHIDFEHSAPPALVELESSMLVTMRFARAYVEPPFVERLRGTLKFDELSDRRARGVLEAFAVGIASGSDDEDQGLDPLFDRGVRVRIPFDVAVEH